MIQLHTSFLEMDLRVKRKPEQSRSKFSLPLPIAPLRGGGFSNRGGELGGQRKTAQSQPPGSNSSQHGRNCRQRPIIVCLSSEYHNKYNGPKGAITTRSGKPGYNCREISTLPRQLDKGDTGPVGPGHYSRVQDRIPRDSLTDDTPQGGSVLFSGAKAPQGGSGKMLSKGAITELPPAEGGQCFYSSLFLIPKKEEGMRPVLNLKSLNEYVVPHHLKKEGIHTL